MSPIARHIEPQVTTLLGAFPAVMVQGARQVGKSTLAGLIATRRPSRVVTLDDVATRTAAETDPVAFVDQFVDGLLVIDEVQRAPDLLVSLKASIDRDRRPGRFLLTGSSNLLRRSVAPDSLAGRLVSVELHGLSQGELTGRSDDLVARLRGGIDPSAVQVRTARSDYAEMIAAGGYPEARALSERLRNVWFDSYVSRLLERDVGDLAPRVDAARIRAVLALVAANQSGELVKARVARAAGVPESTVTTYLDLLDALFLTHGLQPWGANLTSRVSKRTKMLVGDSGLALRLSRTTPQQLEVIGSTQIGGALEGFVAAELIKQRTWSDEDYELYHFRDRSGREVDLVAECGDGSVVAFEVKASSTIRPEHLSGLVMLRDRLGSRFACGVVLYAGTTGVVLGDRLCALPVAALWDAEEMTASGANHRPG